MGQAVRRAIGFRAFSTCSALGGKCLVPSNLNAQKLWNERWNHSKLKQIRSLFTVHHETFRVHGRDRVVQIVELYSHTLVYIRAERGDSLRFKSFVCVCVLRIRVILKKRNLILFVLFLRRARRERIRDRIDCSGLNGLAKVRQV